ADLPSHFGQQLVARGPCQRALSHRRRQGDLDVDLDVGAVHAARIVDGVRIAAAARQAELDPPALRYAEIRALADHLGAHLGSVDANGIVGTVADVLIALVRALHIGADAAEPQQVYRRLEDRIHDLGWRGRGFLHAD